MNITIDISKESAEILARHVSIAGVLHRAHTLLATNDDKEAMMECADDVRYISSALEELHEAVKQAVQTYS